MTYFEQYFFFYQQNILNFEIQDFLIYFILSSMQSDQKNQAKDAKLIATIDSGRMLLQVNDNITYKGQIQISPYYDIQELKVAFQKGQMQVISKTTSKLIIKLGFLKIQMPSWENHEIRALKAKIEDLEKKIQVCDRWIEENLDTKDNFDVNCLYKINTNSGNTVFSTAVAAANLYFCFNAASYSIPSGNKRSSTANWVITRLQKLRA